MKHHFTDIRSRISERPQWWDANGTPRYGAFTAEHCPDPYARTVLLLEIACQVCGECFQAQVHHGVDNSFLVPCYGDPPDHDCTGAVMQSVPLRVLEGWAMTRKDEWQRFASLEVELPKPAEYFARKEANDRRDQ